MKYKMTIIEAGSRSGQRLADTIRLLIEFTNDREINWTKIQCISGKDWSIVVEDGTWVLYVNDENILMYLQLKL